MVKNDSEFLAFYDLMYCYIHDAPRFKQPKSSSIKATALKSRFIYPPFFSGGSSSDQLVYIE
jgi:hypothetical protein